METRILQLIGYDKLVDTNPKIWDKDAFSLYKKDAVAAGATEQEIKNGWKDALAMAKESIPKQWEEYMGLRGVVQIKNSISWEDVHFLGGHSNGDVYFLRLKVGEKVCAIECTDVQLMDVEHIVRKLQFYTVQLIDCPYRSRGMKKNWLPAVIFNWLNSDKMVTSERELTTDNVRDAIYDFAIRPIDASAVPKPWDQIKNAVVEDDIVYLPYTGLRDHVKQITGKEVNTKYTTHVLADMGFERIRRGKERKRFYFIPYDKLSHKNSETRVGEDPETPEGSQGGSYSAWNGAFNDVREEERDGHEVSDGLDDARRDGKTEHTDDSLPSVEAPEPRERQELNEVSF